MRERWRRCTGALALLGAACAAGGGASAGAPSAGDAAADSAVVVALRRGECFGSCAAYEATITRGGTVRIEGRGRSASRAPWRATVPRDSVGALLAVIARSRFLALRDRYVPGEPGCEQAATDHPSATLTVTLEGRTKTIEHYHGCRDAPPELTELENRVDSLAQTGRWLERGG
jgi:hypothetical protein